MYVKVCSSTRIISIHLAEFNTLRTSRVTEKTTRVDQCCGPPLTLTTYLLASMVKCPVLKSCYWRVRSPAATVDSVCLSKAYLTELCIQRMGVVKVPKISLKRFVLRLFGLYSKRNKRYLRRGKHYRRPCQVLGSPPRLSLEPRKECYDGPQFCVCSKWIALLRSS